MKRPSIRAFALLTLLAAVCLSLGDERTVLKNPAAVIEEVKKIKLRGRVVCLAEELNRTEGVPLPTNHEHLWGFKAQDGALYTLLRGKFSEAIFLDARLREKELVLKARVFPKSHIIEVSQIHSVHNGVEHDLYYFCSVCSIKSVSPEICACCRDPVELVEKPLTDKSE